MSTRPSLGQILKNLRKRRQWTLREMSDESGIPLSTLSKVENDRLTLTYDKLVQLSENLKVPISDLFAEPGTGDSVTARRSIGRIGDALRVTTSNYDYYYLCTELRQKRMVPVLTRIRAKTLEEFGDLVSHSGEEYIHVLEGTIVVHTEFYDPVILTTGEAIYIDSNMGHAYVAAEDCEEALVLGVCSSEDEALVNSLMHMHEPMDPGGNGADEARAGVRWLHKPAA